MIHHLVMLKFKPGVEEGQIDALESLLEDLPNKIIEIHLYEFGRDLLQSDRSYDFGLSALFANLEALDRYQKHPEHLKVVEIIRAISNDVIIADFNGSKTGGTNKGEQDWDKAPFDKLLR